MVVPAGHEGSHHPRVPRNGKKGGLRLAVVVGTIGPSRKRLGYLPTTTSQQEETWPSITVLGHHREPSTWPAMMWTHGQ